MHATRPQHKYESSMCKNVVEKEQVVDIVMQPEDMSTITFVESSCAQHNARWSTLGGGCNVKCEDSKDLTRINLFSQKMLPMPANKKGEYVHYGSEFPLECR